MAEQEKILIVDDERLNRNLLVDLLRLDYRTMVAKDGEQALKAARSPRPPDLILLDVMMPEMDGYEVCRLLKQDESTHEIPIIFVTAMNEEVDETKGLELGAADYLTKPISPAILRARVRTHLKLRRSMVELQRAKAVIEAQKDRMQEELNIGHEIQRGMLPKSFPDRDEFEVCAALEPAWEVGGDLYDVFFVDHDHLCLTVGDVSGKGVPAALFMAMTKTLIKSRAAFERSTGKIVTHVNAELSQDNDGCMFVTLLVAILDCRTGELLVTNAGHNPPLLKRADQTLDVWKRKHGPAVGAFKGLTYREEQHWLRAGDRLLIYTDGITEADDGADNLFTEERLETLFMASTAANPRALIDEVLASVHEYEGHARQADDITMLALDYHGGHGRADADGHVFRDHSAASDRSPS